MLQALKGNGRNLSRKAEGTQVQNGLLLRTLGLRDQAAKPFCNLGRAWSCWSRSYFAAVLALAQNNICSLKLPELHLRRLVNSFMMYDDVGDLGCLC